MKELLTLAGGIAIAAVGVFMMSKSSKKATKIIQEHIEVKHVIDECDSDDYTEEDRVNDHFINNSQACVELVKNYSVSVITSIIGCCMTIAGGMKYYKNRTMILEEVNHEY